MTTTLSPLLSAFVAAHNTHDSDAFIACFAHDARVQDEGSDYHGLPAIKAWFEEVSRKYRATLEVTDGRTLDGETVLTGNVSGNFDGSPVQLHYHITIDQDKITALKIVP